MDKYEDHTYHSSDSFSDGIPFEGSKENKIFPENTPQNINDFYWITKWVETMNGKVIINDKQDGETVVTFTIPTNVSLRTTSFIQKVNYALEKNLSDENFGISELCRFIGLSRSQLHNKLKAETGLSTSHFIRSFRLKKALIFLQNSDLNISEIAYNVGFKDPSYFSRLFAQIYGLSPSKLRSSHEEKKMVFNLL